MPKGSNDMAEMPTPEPEKPRFPRFLTLSQVKEILKVGMPTIYALLSSGELRGLQLGGRGYLAYLLRLMRILPGIAGEERRMPREVSVRSLSIVERRCASVAA